jgi:transcription elongation GreA/GreB family factor
VVAVSTEPFDYEGATLMGISPDSPVYKAAEGMQVGDVFEVNGKTWSIDDIA